MVTAVTLALALAFEPAEPNVMRRPPRTSSDAILSRFLVWRVVFVSVVFLAALSFKFALAQAQGASIEEARTIVVNTLVVLEIFYLFSVRYQTTTSMTWQGVKGTPAVLIAVGTVIVLQLIFTYVPFMEAFFDTRPLSFFEGVQVIATGIVVFFILEAEKWVQAKMNGRNGGEAPAAQG